MGSAWRATIFLCLLAASGTGAAVAAVAAETPMSTVWNLGDLYADAAAWQRDYDVATREVEALAVWKGRIGGSARHLADASDAVSAAEKRVARLYVYAQLVADQDTRVAANLERLKQADRIYAGVGEAIAWMRPELLAAGSRRIESFIAKEPRLRVHAVRLREVLRAAPHTLDATGERILSAAKLPLAGAGSIYTQLSASDIPWPSLTIAGKPERIDNQGYMRFRQDPDRAVREQVFQTFFGAWKQYESALGQVLATQVQGQVFDARMRGFGSAREAALFSDALPVAVYDRLIEQAHAGLPVLHRYLRLRAQGLGVKDLAYHDIYPEIVTLPSQSRFDLERSRAITRAALAPFGPKYLAALEKGFAGNWMHALPGPGKRPGAYVFGVAYDVHPYVFLNHQDDFDSLSTFAHEWGHAVHSVLANAAQPWETAQYSTSVAEMASTINSILLLRHVQQTAGSDAERLYFLAQELEVYRQTFFRQAMFGEFEARIHALVEAGESLTGERLTREYGQLLRLYHGADAGVMAIDPRYALEWAYIPHFYRNFYVFQYASSITASAAFAERLLGAEAAQARDAVVSMLESGGAEHPHALFVAAGVDLSTAAPYAALFARMNALMDEMERLQATLPAAARQN